MNKSKPSVLASLIVATLTTGASAGDFVGVTSTTHLGGEGVKTFTDACNDTFSFTARMCTSTEILSATPWPELPIGSSWVRPVYQPADNGNGTIAMDASGVGYIPGGTSCSGWRTSSPGDFGLSIDEVGRFAPRGCEVARSVACCLAGTPPSVSGLPGWAAGALATMLGGVAVLYFANRAVLR